MAQPGIGPRDSSLRPLYRAIVVLSLYLTVRAQGVENITCPSLFLPSPTGAHPCLSLTRILRTVSGDPLLWVVPISTRPLGMYGPPTGEFVELAYECTDIIYNLSSACAACQNGTAWYSRDEWLSPCSGNSGTLSMDSPEIADWMNHTYLPTFDVEEAQIIAQNLPSSSTAEITPSDSSMAETRTHFGPNIGRIVGGVVGIVAFIVIVVLLCAIYLRRRKSRRVSPTLDAERIQYAQTPGPYNIPPTQSYPRRFERNNIDDDDVLTTPTLVKASHRNSEEKILPNNPNRTSETPNKGNSVDVGGPNPAANNAVSSE